MNQYKSPVVSCLICRCVTSAKGIHTHFLSMHTTAENHLRIAGGGHRKIKITTIQQIAAIAKRDKYNLSPNTCTCCKSPLLYESKNNKFCSSSCAAMVNNRTRKENGWAPTKEQRNRISTSLKVTYRKNNPVHTENFNDQIVGPYSKIYLCTCKFSGTKWYSQTTKQIHPSLKSEYEKYSYLCRFAFALSDYPNWFSNATELISKFGWYASASKTHPGISNPDGISRDHRISVNYGFKNKVDPKIISHPANCELMQHKLNSSKHTDCSVTLDSLLIDIDTFNNLHLE